MSGRPEKLIVIGLDGLSPELLKRAIGAGACPRLAELRARGSLASVLAAPPGDAAASWASFGSGTFPATHGVTGLIPYACSESVEARPDCRAAEDEAVRTIAARSRAGSLWQAAARAGKRAVMVNFPGGWPATGEDLIAVDGPGPLASRAVRLLDGHLFATRSTVEKPTHVLRTTQPSGWANPPDSVRAPLEIAFIVTGEAELQPTEYGWMPKPQGGETPKVDPSLMYCGLIIASGEPTDDEEPPFDALVLCRGRDAEHPVATLRAGEWSEWVTEEIGDAGERCTVRFRFQLGSLSAGGREIVLYRTAMFRTGTWASPPEVADRLIEASLVASISRDERSPQREAADGIAWMCGELCRGGEWDLLFTHLPLPDAVLHEKLNELHPGSPQYRLENEAEAWAQVAEAMAVVDAFVGEVLEGCAGEDTVVAVVSPHGMLPTHKYVWLGKPLIEAGLTVYVTDEETDGMRVHLPESQAVLADHPLAQGVWVNLQGRDAEGTVPPEQYERVRTDIINALLSMRDPFTNACPVALAFRREGAGFLGLAGDAVGDVVYFLAPGYTTDPRIPSAGLIDPSLISVDAVCGSAGPLQGVHHGYLPGAELGGFTTNGVLLLHGPGVREGGERPTPIRTPDVTATLCRLLALNAPTGCEGLVATELLERN